MTINPDIIEKFFNVKIKDGGFSFHKNYSEIGMNIHDDNGIERDFFITVKEYLKCEKIINQSPIEHEGK